MDDISEKTLLFYDISGSYVSFAQRLAREFGHVLYYTNWKSAYPTSIDTLIGDGFDDIERILDFEDYIDVADCFFFADCYDGSLQEHLVGMGKPVWGARKGDELELDRMKTVKLLKQLGLPVPNVTPVIGLQKLREYLKANDGIFVKISRFRGDAETFGSPNYKISEPILDELEHRLGARKYIEQFLCFKGIDAVCETGIDCFTIDGKFPAKTLFGYEIKDCGYGGTIKEYAKLSPLLTDVNAKLAPTMGMYNYRGFFSTELRVTEDKVPYMIDFTARIPAPPGGLMQEIISNLGAIVWGGAHGELVEPEFIDDYGVEIIIRSSWATTNWQSIYFPEEISKFVKIKNCTKIKGTHYYIPANGIEMHEIGSVVATGKSMEECAKKVKSYIDQIEGYGLEMNTEGIMDKLQKQIEAGESVGIDF